MPKYFEVGGNLVSNVANITIGETTMVNPNSLVIMENIYENLISRGEKEWVFLVARGPPYTLLRLLIKEEGYDWVAIMSGMGDLNMNQLKTFFAVANHICFDVSGEEVLNFKTKKAYTYFMCCKDMHQSWKS